MPLTDTAVRNARPAAKPYKLSDGGGLFLLVETNGSRLWRKAYRFAGKQKLLSIGPYPTVSLADARTARDQAKKDLAAGIDPSAKKRLAKLQAAVEAANTFEAVAAEFIERRIKEGDAERTVKKLRWLIGLASRLAKRPVSDIQPAEVYDVLHRIERTGRLETARRLRGTLSRVFRFAVVTARATLDPAAPLIGATSVPTVRHRAALTEPAKVGGLIRASRSYDGCQSVRLALNLLPLVLVRSSELRYARRLEFDLDGALWSIPGPRMKMDRPHFVPLARQAVEMLRPVLDDLEPGDLVFPSVRTNRRPISENSVNAALRRMGYATDEMTGHGWRRTAKTAMGEHGWDDRWSERQLAHKDPNRVREAYDAAEFLEGRTRMMQWWADRLDLLAADEDDLIG